MYAKARENYELLFISSLQKNKQKKYNWGNINDLEKEFHPSLCEGKQKNLLW